MRENPYFGPQAIPLKKTIYGRDRERRDLVNLLVAERILLIHSPSGAGKTSLIQAGVIPELIRRNFRVLPIIRIGLKPPPGLIKPGVKYNRYEASAILSMEESVPENKLPPIDTKLEAYLSEWRKANGNLDGADSSDKHALAATDSEAQPDGNNSSSIIPEVLIFDQFEEILTLDPIDQKQKEEFFAQLGEVLKNRSRWAIFSMRDDHVAALEPFLRFIPTRLATRYRLDLLTRSNAKLAIQNPAKNAGVGFSDAAADTLVDYLSEVKIPVAGGELKTVSGPYVEPVQLQVVCRKVWENLPAGLTEIGVGNLGAKKDMEGALKEYYRDQVMRVATTAKVRERDIREWFGQRLITEQGLRNQVLKNSEQGEVIKGAERTDAKEEQVLTGLHAAFLIRAEERHNAIWYELAHDRLIDPVKSDNADWFENNLSNLQKQARLYEKDKNNPNLLLRGSALSDAQQWADQNPLEISETEKAFLRASHRAQWNARLVKGLAILMTILFFVAVFFFLQAQAATKEAKVARDDANEARDKAVAATTGALAAQIKAGVARVAAVVAQIKAEEARDEARAATGRAVIAEGKAKTEAENAETERGKAVIAEGKAKTEAENAKTERGKAVIAEGKAKTEAENAETERGKAVTAKDAAERLSYISNARAVAASAGQKMDDALAPKSKLNLKAASVEQAGALALFSNLELLSTTPDNPVVTKDGLEALARALSLSRLKDNLSPSEVGSSHITSVGFKKDCNCLVTAEANGRVTIYNFDTKTKKSAILSQPGPKNDKTRPELKTNRITNVAVSADGNFIGITRQTRQDKLEDNLEIYQLMGDDPKNRADCNKSGLTGHQRGTSKMVFSSDGKYLATATNFGRVAITEVETSKELWSRPGVVETVRVRLFHKIFRYATAMAFTNPKDKEPLLLVVAYQNGDGAVYDAVTGQEIKTRRFVAARYDTTGQQLSQESIQPHSDLVLSLALSADNRKLVTTGRDKRVIIWQFPKDDRPPSPKMLQGLGHEDAVISAAFNADGKLLATGSQDHKIILWKVEDVAAGEQLMTFPGHSGYVNVLTFGADGDLASGSSDYTVKVWATQKDLKPLAELEGQIRECIKANQNGDNNTITPNPDIFHLIQKANDIFKRGALTKSDCEKYWKKDCKEVGRSPGTFEPK